MKFLASGRRRPAPEPEPGFLDEIADLPEPPMGAPREGGMPAGGPRVVPSPCGNERVGDHLLTADGTCWYGCDVAGPHREGP